MKKLYVLMLMTVVLLFTLTGRPAAEPQQDLIRILEKKGVITKEEAASLGRDGEALISLRGGNVLIGGEFELEFIKSDKNNDSGNNSNARMSIDKIVITPQVKFSDRITFRADVEFAAESHVKVDEAWVKFTGLPVDSWLMLGLDDIFMKPHRKTESYPLLGYAFWQDEDLGVYLGGKKEMVYWRLSVTNGRRLADRKIAEDNVYPITTDDDNNVEANAHQQIGVGIGLDHTFKEAHKIDVLPFYYTSELSDADVAHLQGITGYGGGFEDRDQRRYGFNVEYIMRDFTLFGQYMKAEDGTMDRDGWYLQPSYKMHYKGRNVFTASEVLLRYEEYNVDLANNAADSNTWDRQTTTLAVITDVVKNLKVKIEYYLNDEDTGGAEVDNDELLVQLEAKF
jgi:hypothetical protein